MQNVILTTKQTLQALPNLSPTNPLESNSPSPERPKGKPVLPPIKRPTDNARPRDNEELVKRRLGPKDPCHG